MKFHHNPDCCSRMKFHLAVSIVLLALARATRLTVKIDTIQILQSAPFELSKDAGQYTLTCIERVDVGSIWLLMQLQIEAGKGEYFETDFCDDDISTKNGTMALIVRKSLGVTCPVEKGVYQVRKWSLVDGELGQEERGTQAKLLAVGFDADENGEGTRYFGISYDVEYGKR